MSYVRNAKQAAGSRQSKARHNEREPRRPIVIGYYTVNTPYEQEAETLKVSLDALQYEHDIRGVPNLGSWQKNTQYKANFVRGMLEEYAPRPCLYLDVDAVMVSPPVILDTLDCDIAAVHFGKTTELLSGTVYWGNTAMCRLVVDRWLALNERYPKTLPDHREAWDQRTLDMAIRETPACRFVELPQEYTWITELTQRQIPGLTPVIMHTRGALRWKRQINARGLSGQAPTTSGQS